MKKYDSEKVDRLAREWTRRMQWMYDAHVTQDDIPSKTPLRTHSGSHSRKLWDTLKGHTSKIKGHSEGHTRHFTGHSRHFNGHTPQMLSHPPRLAVTPRKLLVTRLRTDKDATPSNNTNNCSIKLRSRTHPLPHRCPHLRTKVKSSGNNSCNKRQRHRASNSMDTPSQRQVTQGPQSQLSGPEQQNARASRPNRGGSVNNSGSSWKWF